MSTENLREIARGFRQRIYNAYGVESEELFIGLETQFLSELKEWVLSLKRPMDGKYYGFGDEYNRCKTCSHHLSECVCKGWNAALEKLAEDMK